LRECRSEFVHQIGAQCVAPLGILAFGLIGDPAVEFGEKLAGMKLLPRPGDGIRSGHVFLSNAQVTQPIGIRRPPEASVAFRNFGLPKPAGMQQFPPS
jgi:hypothetical protein